MSRVSECLKQIMSARYGKDVRQSIHDGIEELDEVARTAQGSATLSAQTAIDKANEALAASQAAIESAKQAKAYSDNAQAVAGVTVATQDNAGLVKGGENHIGLDGTLELVVKTTEASMPNSRKGRLAVDEIGGVCVQDNIPSPELPQEIKKSVISEIRTSGTQLYDVGGVKQTAIVSVDDNGWITVEYDNTNGTSIMYMVPTPPISKSIKPNQNYLLVTEVKEISVSTFQVCSTDTSNNKSQFITDVVRNTTGISTRIITSRKDFSGCSTLLRTIVGVNAGSKGRVVFRVSVLEDTTITADTFVYEPYIESSITLSKPIELYRIGDVQDVIEDGKVKRRFKKVEFDGSSDEVWVTSSLKAGRYYVDGVANSKLLGSALCTHSIHNNWATDVVNNSYFSESVDGRFIINTSFATLDEWKAHLQANPMTVAYELATETNEELPLADQIALNSLETFEGVTYIEFVSEVQPTFAGKYGASLVGGAALEGAMRSRENSLALSGDSFEFKEHGLTFKGLKIGKMMVLHVSGELDYGLTDENKVMTFETKIPDGFKPYIDTNAAVMNIKSKLVLV